MNIADGLKILKVSAGADLQDVKKAYRLLCKKYHPDIYKGGNKKMVEITEAYNVVRKFIESGQQGTVEYDSWQSNGVYTGHKKQTLIITVEDLYKLIVNNGYLLIEQNNDKVYKEDLSKYNVLVKLRLTVQIWHDDYVARYSVPSTVKFTDNIKEIKVNPIQCLDKICDDKVRLVIKVLDQETSIITSAKRIKTKLNICGIDFDFEIERIYMSD